MVLNHEQLIEIMGCKLLAVFISALIFSGIVFAVSSEEASAKAKPYLDSGVGLLPKPFFVSSDYYYVFSPSIYSPKKIFVAVSEESGEVESDSTRLGKIGEAVFDYGITEEYVKRNKISFAEMQTPVRQTLLAVDRNANALAALESKTQESYPDTNFDSVKAKALDLQALASELDGIVTDGVGLEQQVEGDYSDFALSGLVDYYKNAFEKAAEFISSYDAYNSEISKKQADVFKSNIPAPDNENIVKSMENMRLKVDLFESLRFLKPAESIAKLEASRSKWVNDSVASFSYKKATVDVQAKFNALKPDIETVFYADANIAQCGLSSEAESIKSRWRDVQVLMERASEKDYARLPSMLDSLKTQYDALKKSYESCLRPSQYIPPEEVSPQVNYLPWIVLLVIIAGGYLLWRRRQNEETYS